MKKVNILILLPACRQAGLLFCILYFAFSSFAQTLSPQVISTAGDYSVGSNGSLSWTIGETITETYTNGNNILTQGFQQDTTIIVKIQDLNISFLVSVYPNPANDYLVVEFLSPFNTGINIDLFDMQGKKISAGSLPPSNGSTTVKKQVDIKNFASADYLLNITSANGRLIKSYKIIKH